MVLQAEKEILVGWYICGHWVGKEVGNGLCMVDCPYIKAKVMVVIILPW